MLINLKDDIISDKKEHKGEEHDDHVEVNPTIVVDEPKDGNISIVNFSNVINILLILVIIGDKVSLWKLNESFYF